MQQALRQAESAAARGEVPVGAVLVQGEQLVAAGGNRCIELNDASAHAEIVVLREAGRVLNNYRLPGTTLYVTLEPCCMCAGALVHARVQRVVFGAFDPKAGAVCSRLKLWDSNFVNHRLQWLGGVMELPCKRVLQAFFKRRR